MADQLAHLRGRPRDEGWGSYCPWMLVICYRPRWRIFFHASAASANPMPAKQLAKVLQDEWGPNWQQHFADFSFMPLAAASIGQVHQAYHDNGQRLAVKVQYPGIKQSIDSDVDNVATLLRISGIIPAEVDYHSLLAEAKLQLKAEADYLQEAAHLSEYRQLLRADLPIFCLPESIAALNTSNILVMSYVDGVPIESLTTQSQAVRDRVMRLLFALLFRELFEFALVQTDPNFANYLYNTDGAVGAVGFWCLPPLQHAV